MAYGKKKFKKSTRQMF